MVAVVWALLVSAVKGLALLWTGVLLLVLLLIVPTNLVLAGLAAIVLGMCLVAVWDEWRVG